MWRISTRELGVEIDFTEACIRPPDYERPIAEIVKHRNKERLIKLMMPEENYDEISKTCLRKWPPPGGPFPFCILVSSVVKDSPITFIAASSVRYRKCLRLELRFVLLDLLG